VIARVWRAQAAPDRARAYADHVRAHVLPALRRQPGYVRMLLLQRPVSGMVEVAVVTLWRSLDAVRGFAGSDVEQAVVADEAAALLAQYDRRAQHYEVVLGDETGG
jgi:heme-degrading monooxygenase HmoA